MKNNKYVIVILLFLGVVFLQQVYAQSINDAFGAGSNNTNDAVPPPTVKTQDIVVNLDSQGNVSIIAQDIDNGSSSVGGIASLSLDQTNFDCNDLGVNNVVLTVTNNAGETATGTANVTILDNLDPVVVTKDITVQLDINGQASISPSDIDNNSSDNCGIANTLLNISSFDCSKLGAKTVTLRVTDTSGNTSSQTATVTVKDNLNPVAVTQDITVQLDVNGQASISPSDIDNGSSDNCSIANTSLNVSGFDCTNLGANTVAFTVEDGSGNTNTKNAIVTVQDNTAPTFSALNDINVNSTANSEVVNYNLPAITDNCLGSNITGDNYPATPSGFTKMGVFNGHTYFVSNSQDSFINFSSQVDNIQDAHFATITDANENNFLASYLDNNGVGNAYIGLNDKQTEGDFVWETGEAVNYINWSTGNPSNSGVGGEDVGELFPTGEWNDLPENLIRYAIIEFPYSIEQTVGLASGSTFPLGTTVNTFKVYDKGGNTITGSFNVTVTEIPSVSTENIIVNLDSSGNASITPQDIDNGSSSVNGIASLSLDQTNFDCNDLGVNNVVLTVKNNAGETATGTADVTVEDNLAPTAIGKDFTVDLAGNPSVSITPENVDNNSFDNCSTVNLSIDIDTFTSVGDFPVKLSVTDNQGNRSIVKVMVTVEDNTLGISNPEDSKIDIDLYPNPTSSLIHVKTNATINSFRIMDINGKVILSDSKSGNSLNVAYLSEGIYFVVINVERGRSVIKKFIKKDL